ncbi:MAG: lycopene cyclase domain-containing protein [Calditrichia bacterium]
MHTAMLVGIPAGIWFWVDGKEYTALVLIALGLVGFLERALQTGIFSQSRTWRFLAIVSGLTLVFNGYLTARPVVLYNPAFQLDFRIFTIPVEDFGYGISLVLFNVLLFEFFKQKAAAKSDTMVESVSQLTD